MHVSEKHEQRFPIEPGALGVMTCGVNGEKQVQQFRPTHITAVWSDGVLVDARVWGPQILDDGAVGERLIDHRWRKTRTSHIRYTDLPRLVARKLLTYGRTQGFTSLPEQLADSVDDAD
jgi:hypothetical protein